MPHRASSDNPGHRSPHRGRRASRLLIAAAVALTGMSGHPARAESVQSRVQNDLSDLVRLLGDWASQIGQKSRGEVLSFLNKVELFNLDSEIDRLVGDPWQMSDSTTYKLRLAPLHVAYPVFDEQVRQMTRLDDLRTRRIQDLTVDSVGLIAINLNVLDHAQSGGQLASSVVHYFNARELLDLGVFLLAQQPFFPDTPERWDESKRQLAKRQGMLAAGALGLGAVFEVGALSNSGSLKRCQDGSCGVGWYGGFSRLGYHMRPRLRGGITARLPRVEVSAGVMEQMRPESDTAYRAFEAAVRESWLGRYTAAAGWDSFVEAAVRRVLATRECPDCEAVTARGGLFIKRDHPLRLRHVTLRSSFEVESGFGGSLRYAFSLGLDYTKTGLATVLQSSRTSIPREGGAVLETRTGLLVAGTIESPEQYYVDAMQVQARLLREEWEELVQSELARRQKEAELRVLASGTSASRLRRAVESFRQASEQSEASRTRAAVLLADYVEGRRLAYSLKQWQRSPDDVYGPVDDDVLRGASAALIARLTELATFLHGAESELDLLRERYARAAQALATLKDRQDPAASEELFAIDRDWRQSSDSTLRALQLYEHYVACARRITGVAQGLMPAASFDLLGARSTRRLILLAAQPLQ